MSVSGERRYLGGEREGMGLLLTVTKGRTQFMVMCVGCVVIMRVTVSE